LNTNLITNDMKIKNILAALVLMVGTALGQGQFAGGGSGNGTITGATSGGGLVVTGGTLGLLTSCSVNQILQWNGTSWVCANAGSGSSAFSALTSGTNTTGAFLIGSGSSLGTTGSGTNQATSLTGLTACEPLIGNGSNPIIGSAGFCYASRETGATADVKINNAAKDAVSLGGYAVIVDLQGAQTIAAPPLGGASFTGYMEVLPGAAYSCTYTPGANLGCWPVPAKVTVDWLTNASGASSSGFSGGGSYLLLTLANQVGFCLGATSNATGCPSAGGTQAQQSLVKWASVHGNNLQGVTLFQNYEGEEFGGFDHTIGVAYGYHGTCADIGGGASGAINSTLNGLNCSLSQGASTVAFADAVGVKINGGTAATDLVPRNMGDFSVTNSCTSGTNSCTNGGAGSLCNGTSINCAQPNDGVQIAGAAGELGVIHVETVARGCVNIGNITISGSDTAIATGGILIHNVDCNAGEVRISNGASVSNITILNTTKNVASGNTINDQKNTAISATLHQQVAAYITGDAGQVMLDTSNTNVSGVIVSNLHFPVTAAGSSSSGGVAYFSSGTQLSSSGTLASGRILLGGGAGGAPTSDANLDDGVTTANTLTYGGSAGISAVQLTTTSASNAGAVALGGNTANPSLAANSVILLGPASASFTNYALQFPSTAPSGTQYFNCGTPSSNVSTCAWTNDRGPGGLTWTINPVLSSSAPNAAFHVSQYGQDVYISIAAATAGVVATGYNSTTLSTFTGDTVALRLDTTMSDATELASFEIGTNSTNKIDIYPYNGVLYSVAWDSTNNLNSCGTGFAYLVQGGGLSCSAPTLVYQPSAMPFLRICLGCNLNGASRTSTTWYTDYSSDGLADSANSHWVAYGSIAKASFSWSSTSGVIVYMGAEAVTTTGTYPGYVKFSCVAVNGQGGCGGDGVATSFTSVGSTAGFLDLPQGSDSGSISPCNAATSICIEAPTSVTSQKRILAGTPATGFPLFTNSSGTMTETITPVEGTISTGPFLFGSSAVNTVVAQTIAVAAGHFTNLVITASLGGSCTTAPTFNVFDGTSNTGTAKIATSTTQTKGTATNQTQTLTYAAGDLIGIYISTAGATCTTDTWVVSAEYSTP
jgi:hypothetical protein